MKRIIANVLGFIIAIELLPIHDLSCSAICCCKDRFDLSGYKPSGNMAEDVATIAKLQKGRTGAQFGYTEDWCDEFVADCIEIAGGDSSIVGHGGTVYDFEEVMKNKGAVPVDKPQTGDIVFFNFSHVEIVTHVDDNGVVYVAGGNNGELGYSENPCAGERILYAPARLYLRPNYKSLPVIAPIVSTNSSCYIPGVDIDINWNYISGATSYWIDLYQDGEHIISSNIGNVNSYSLKNATNAEYEVYVTAFKDNTDWQSACSEPYHFSVKDVNAPQVYTNHEYYAPDAKVDIMWNLVEGATGYWIDIYQGDEHILSESLNDKNCSKYTYQCTNGKYGVYVTAYCENGGWNSACSNCYNFYVQDVLSPEPIINGNCFTPNSEAEVKWDKIDSASGYWIDIYHDGEHIINENIGNVLSYNITDLLSGKYEVFVSAYNEWGGWTTSHDEAISFWVKERPSQPLLNIVTNYSNVTLEWNQCDNTDFYGVRIINAEDGSSCLYEEPYEGNDYTTTLPAGKYFANIASVQKDGFYTFSEDISFEIEESNVEGDCNNDGKCDTTDVIALQKWILHTKNAKLSNSKASDLNNNGVVDVFDLGLLKRKLIIKN